MGDGAAYSIAFIIGYYSLKTHSITTGSINEWFFGCLLAYPVMELLFSFSRRILDKKSIFDPDKKHLHSILYYLINKKYYPRHDLSNPLATSLLIFSMITFNTITLYYLFNDQGYLKYLFFSFCLFYLIINYLFLKIYKNVTIL